MVAPLTKKLFRDLLRLRGQALTIALVVAAGVASWVSLRSTFHSLVSARDAYYERQSFGEVFADCKRAPAALADRITSIPGVSRGSVTAVGPVRLRMPNEATPPTGVLIGLPAAGPSVDIPRVMSGRSPEPGSDEALVLSAFAEAHQLTLGDTIVMVVTGSERRVRIVGTAASPEYLFAVAPGDVTADAKRFGVVWMDQDAARTLLDLSGAFNHVALELSPGANEASVIADLDRLLAPYGAVGAFPRKDQLSHRTLAQELDGLKGMATVAPIIFLGVAAFLLNAVLGRLVALERPEIAALRALGYTGFEVARHYVWLVLLIAGIGAGLGAVLGVWFGRALVDLYAGYFHFPDPPFVVDPELVGAGVAISLGAAILGALAAARRIIRLPPAEAMRPPAPAAFARGLLERSGLMRWLSPAARMVVREVTRKPGRMVMSVIALSFAYAINVIGGFNADVLDDFVSVMFSASMREDVAVGFRQPVSERALGAIAAMPGVRQAEPLRTIPVEIRKDQQTKQRVLVGHPPNASLRRFVDQIGQPVPLPERGVAIDDYTAGLLEIRVGDRITMRLLEGDRRTVEVEVERIFAGMTSLEAHTSLAVLRELSGTSALSSVLVVTDPEHERALVARLNDAPQVFSVTRRSEVLARFEALTGQSTTIMALLLSVFAGVIAIGVVYNDARILLSSQARELASLRVLGFTRAEVSNILLGQIAIEVVLAIAPGLALGKLGAEAMMSAADPELYRFAIVISAKTYLRSAGVVIAAAIISALLVRRRVDKLDLIQVLKTRD